MHIISFAHNSYNKTGKGSVYNLQEYHYSPQIYDQKLRKGKTITILYVGKDDHFSLMYHLNY